MTEHLRSARLVLAFGAVAAFPFLGGGCAEDCADIVHPALRIEVVDSATSQPILDGVTVVIRSGSAVDTLSGVRTDSDPERVVYQGGTGRPGIYEVEVTRPGYADWMRGGVVADPTRCGLVRTVELTVRLRR